MDIVYMIIAICAIVGIIGYVAYTVIKIYKMPKEERRELLKTYLKGLIAYAEKKIGSGKGKEKLSEVEKTFEKKAPFIYKLILKYMGKENLQELIEEALKEIKENFSK